MSWSSKELVAQWKLAGLRHAKYGCEPGKFGIPTSGQYDIGGFEVSNEMRCVVFDTSCMYTHLTDLVMVGWN